MVNMDIENIIQKDNNILYTNMKSLDMDPTRNEKLYLDLWDRLKEKIEKEMKS